mgnify:CR=1 FL=1
MSAERSRSPLIDVIKAVAAQLIVLHHLAWYGPMTDVAAGLSPLLDQAIQWMAAHGRLAVAAFLAVGGFLAAQGLTPRGLPAGKSPQGLIIQRYLRLIGPYSIALVLAIVGAALARLWMTHESIGAPPTAGQIVAHLFLLHDLFDYEALSAGIWYIAIDFQLYALFVLLLWSTGLLFGRSASTDFAGIAVVAFVALASLFFFNLHPGWDATALYFFGAYALGAGSAWAVRSVRPHLGLALLALLGILALSFDFRPRIAIALVVAVILGLSHLHLRLNGSHVLSLLSRSSYALFLVHFPICLVVNALFNAWAPDHPGLNALGVLVAWIASNAVALMFYQHVEIRLASAFSRWGAGRFAH